MPGLQDRLRDRQTNSPELAQHSVERLKPSYYLLGQLVAFLRCSIDSICSSSGTLSILTFLIAAGTVASLHAQTIGATLSGIVADPTGRSVPKAELMIRNVSTRVVRTSRTDDSGFYATPNLLPGTYEITVSAIGFETARTHMVLTVGSEQQLNITLHLGLVEQTIDVAEPATNIELTSSAIGAAIGESTIQELPLNGRSWTDLAVLEPGTLPVEAQYSYTSGNSRGNRGFGTQLTISGARPQQNNYRLDGISINDYSNGGPGSVLGGNLGVAAIQEFSIYTAHFPASYGRSSGGVINATTNSGSNSLHGSAYEFLRNSVLDARNFFDGVSKPPFRRNQFGASAGGPLIKNRTFIFGDYEGIRQSTGVTNIATVPSLATRSGMLSTGQVVVNQAAAQYLTFYPFPNAGLLGSGDTGVFRFVGQQVANEDFFTLRADHQISAKDSVFSTYRFDNAQFSAPDSLNTQLIGSGTRSQTGVVEEDHTFSPSMFNSTRLGINREVAQNYEGIQALNPATNDTSIGAAPGLTAAAITVPGLTAFGGGLGGTGTYLFHYTSIQFYDDLFLTRGLHSVRLGFALERIRNNVLARAIPTGQFIFGSLVDFLTNQPTSLQFGESQSLTPRGLRQTVPATYLQDDWRLRPHLTLNLGLRYEMATVPTEVNGKLSVLRSLTDSAPHIGSPYFSNPTYKNFQPRVGLAWDPFGDGKTAIRSGFGIYDVLPLPYEFELLASLAAPFYQLYTAANLPSGSFPNGATRFLSPSSLAEVYIEPHPHRSYVLQWNLNVQRKLTKDFTVSASYIGSKGVHQPFRTDDANVVLPQPTSKGYLWPSPAASGTVINPASGQIRALFWDENTEYDALELNAIQKWRRGFQIQGAFTWSKSIDSGSSTLVGNAFSNSISGLPWYDRQVARGVSDFHIPRIVVVQGIWAIPFTSSRAIERWAFGEWTLAGIFKASDGIPFTPQIAGDPLGQKSVATFDFPDTLLGPGCQDPINPGNAQHYIKTQCFALPAPATRLGDTGRNSLTGPGLANLDFVLAKNIPIREAFRMQVRAEFFNIFNRANFLPPLSNLGLFDATGRPIASAGLLTATATSSRQLQFGLKVLW